MITTQDLEDAMNAIEGTDPTIHLTAEVLLKQFQECKGDWTKFAAQQGERLYELKQELAKSDLKTIEWQERCVAKDFEIHQLKADLSDSKLEVTQLKSYLEQANEETLERVKVFRKYESELAAAQKANAAMRDLLSRWKAYFQLSIPKNEDEQHSHGELFSHLWFETEQALSPTSGEGWVRLNWRPGTERPERKTVVIYKRRSDGSIGSCNFSGAERDWNEVVSTWLPASELLGKEGK